MTVEVNLWLAICVEKLQSPMCSAEQKQTAAQLRLQGGCGSSLQTELTVAVNFPVA